MEFMDHFTNPKNIGVLANANGIGESGSPGVGNYLQFFLYIEDDVGKQASYLIQGRPQAIAAASYASLFVIGRNTQELMQLSTCDLRKIFQWPGSFYEPCLKLVIESIKNAIIDYWRRLNV